jgi:predicted RecB family nuclease
VSQNARHLFFLEELCNHLDQIGIDRQQVEMIFKEPLWTDNKVPDIIIRMKSGRWYLIELKGNKKKRHKAIKQLAGGRKLLNKLGVAKRLITKVFVVYSTNGYEYEVM